MKIDWRIEAVKDLDDAFQWYEDQRRSLGGEFVREADANMAALLSIPQAHPVVLKDVRRIILKRFPYGVYYLLEKDRIVVIAVLHLKRDIQALLTARVR